MIIQQQTVPVAGPCSSQSNMLLPNDVSPTEARCIPSELISTYW